MKERVAEDGEELLHRIDMHVADEIKRIASGVCCSSGANAFNVPVGTREKFANLKPNSVQELAQSSPNDAEVRAAGRVLERRALLHEGTAGARISLGGGTRAGKDADGCEKAGAIVSDYRNAVRKFRDLSGDGGGGHSDEGRNAGEGLVHWNGNWRHAVKDFPERRSNRRFLGCGCDGVGGGGQPPAGENR